MVTPAIKIEVLDDVLDELRDGLHDGLRDRGEVVEYAEGVMWLIQLLEEEKAHQVILRNYANAYQGVPKIDA